MMDASKLKELPILLRLWYHECCRVFEDRLVNEEDRGWFQTMMVSKLTEFGVAEDDVINQVHMHSCAHTLYTCRQLHTDQCTHTASTCVSAVDCGIVW